MIIMALVETNFISWTLVCYFIDLLPMGKIDTKIICPLFYVNTNLGSILSYLKSEIYIYHV